METPDFLADARSMGLSDEERLGIVTWIAANPAAGKVIEGGVDIPVFLLNIFAKNEKIDLAAQERHVLKGVLADIVKTYRSGGGQR